MKMNVLMNRTFTRMVPKVPKPSTANERRGSFRCGNNCLTCNYINDGLTKYTFHSTGETRFINHHIDCNSKNTQST